MEMFTILLGLFERAAVADYIFVFSVAGAAVQADFAEGQVKVAGVCCGNYVILCVCHLWYIYRHQR